MWQQGGGPNPDRQSSNCRNKTLQQTQHVRHDTGVYQSVQEALAGIMSKTGNTCVKWEDGGTGGNLQRGTGAKD